MTARASSGLPRAAGTIIAVATIAAVLQAPVAAAEVPISAAVASLYIGRQQLVEGKVEAAERRDNTVRLHLGTTPQSLVVSLVIGLLSRFPDRPEQFYLGKNIRVTGTIESFRGTPEITIHDPDHIAVVDRNQAATRSSTTASAASPASDEGAQLRQQIEEMRTQMKELESRLKQLEGDAP